MTVQELIDWCNEVGISLDTPIAIRSKDDYLLVSENIQTDNHPYFGNCPNGDDYLKEVAPKNEDGDVDYENLPTFLMLGTE